MNKDHDRQHTYVSPDGFYALTYPKTWEVEIDSDCTSFFRKYHGVGALQISAFESPTRQSSFDNLREYLTGNDISAEIVTGTLVGGEELATAEFQSETSLTKVWFVTRHTYVVFVTYVCDPSTVKIEEQEVEEMVRSLSLAN